MKPDDGGVHNNYGLLLVKMKKIDQAKAELAKAAEIEPASAGKYYFNLGAVMVNNQQNDAALEAFQKAVAADPKYAPAWYYIGNVLSNKMTMDKDGKPDPPPGMQDALEKYLSLDPNGPYADAAKGLLSVISTSIQTTYQNPDARRNQRRSEQVGDLMRRALRRGRAPFSSMLRYILILLFVLIMLPVLRGWLGVMARMLMNWSLGTGPACRLQRTFADGVTARGGGEHDAAQGPGLRHLRQRGSRGHVEERTARRCGSAPRHAATNIAGAPEAGLFLGSVLNTARRTGAR